MYWSPRSWRIIELEYSGITPSTTASSCVPALLCQGFGGSDGSLHIEDISGPPFVIIFYDQSPDATYYSYDLRTTLNAMNVTLVILGWSLGSLRRYPLVEDRSH
jgi:hypothetical protein